MTGTEAHARAAVLLGPGAEVWVESGKDGLWCVVAVNGFGQVAAREMGRGRKWESALNRAARRAAAKETPKSQEDSKS